MTQAIAKFVQEIGKLPKKEDKKLINESRTNQSNQDEEQDHFKYKKHLINPYGTFDVYRSNLIQLLIIYIMTFGVFKICFVDDDLYPFWDFIDLYVIGAVFFLDMILIFFTGLMKEGEPITDMREIAKNYLLFFFWIDCISLFPFDIVFDFKSDPDAAQATLRAVPRLMKALRILRLLRINKVHKIDSRTLLQFLMNFAKSLKSIIGKIIVMMIRVSLWAHMMNCFFYLISESSDDRNSWLYSSNYIDQEALDRYITSFYFVISTITTTGYGDIVPVTIPERAFAAFIIFSGVIFFGFSINKVVEQINN